MTTATKNKLRQGQIREDGSIFYSKKIDGREQWLTPTAFHRKRVNTALFGARRRAEKQHSPFDIDLDYLLSIFPSDWLCPALRVKMGWCDGDRDTSPSLDRHVPAHGYVRGNVSWLSTKANRIKTNATTDEVIRVADYLKGLKNCT